MRESFSVMPSALLYCDGKPMSLNASPERRCCGSEKLTSVTRTGELVFATGFSSVPFQDLPIVRDVWRPLALISVSVLPVSMHSFGSGGTSSGRI